MQRSERGWFNIVSEVPDSGNHANVWLRADPSSGVGSNVCLTAMGNGTGPAGSAPGSADVELAPCTSGYDAQVWAMARAGNDVGYNITPESFFNFAQHVCLDGGLGHLFAWYSSSGCFVGDQYQAWIIDHNKPPGY